MNTTQKIDGYFQQGDVLIKSCDEIKGDIQNHLVLQEGEMTGHAHRVSDGLAELFLNGSTKYLRVKSDTATISHEEHNAITIPKGLYKIGIVREYDHFAEEARNVKD